MLELRVDEVKCSLSKLSGHLALGISSLLNPLSAFLLSVPFLRKSDNYSRNRRVMSGRFLIFRKQSSGKTKR